MTATKVLTVHVPLPLANKVDQMASRLDRSCGWIMKQALSAWIAQEDERDRLTQEALADVDAGHVIDHQSVQTWAESLSTNQVLSAPLRATPSRLAMTSILVNFSPKVSL